jgi:hypothetical protein
MAMSGVKPEPVRGALERRFGCLAYAGKGGHEHGFKYAPAVGRIAASHGFSAASEGPAYKQVREACWSARCTHMGFITSHIRSVNNAVVIVSENQQRF